MLTFEVLCLLSAICGQPSTITIPEQQPFMCATNEGCELLAAEYGCTTFHGYLWCDTATYRNAIIRHKA